MTKRLHRQEGLTLIEVLIAMTIGSMIVILSISYLNIVVRGYITQQDTLRVERNMRFALNYIEKRIRECDQNQIIYHSDTRTIEGRNYDNQSIWIDLSGNKRSQPNTLIYFYKDTGELRVNKNNENNVLVNMINDIIVNELVEGKLIEIEIFGHGSSHPIKTILRLTNPLDGVEPQ
ncbi:hypothetical protein Amet_2485 [Alkaliphilus metalliredigens QYMF]|uniref:Prepilin-type N-terminal cleavage/methylation domain-containing protein n=1 Tax=Alkaliphilus metalliredigens (strain QYMF) TaxID=293826 RepID=A6TR20_ALKMQ|nr:prepilin-type N-terminal cleavage/methylation domain-containing protein [Alkaliphilus metalliredigens]ABR48638.1 hypothetical protein Amet_2485 [Alkaliphilus metalliredigens QYMF]